jgi:hypothetical protein
MPARFLRVLFVALTGLAVPARLAAQTPDVRHPATDTLQPANPNYRQAVSQIETTGGQRLYVFLQHFGPVQAQGVPDRVEFTWRHPQTLPRPKLVRMPAAQIKWLRWEGAVYEPVRTDAAHTGVLAVRASPGPRLALFDVATPKPGVPIPLPGAIIWTGAFRSRYNHAWYVRAPGEAFMRAVPDGRAFAPFAAALLADDPDLAAAIQAKTEGHRHDDLPLLLERYNNRPAAPSGAR